MKNFIQKWGIYQKERFPLLVYSILILTLTLASASITDNFKNIFEAFIIALGIFMLLRIADEFKDYDDDCKYRAYRAVPRGLITLKELAVLGAIIIAIELFLAYTTQTFTSMIIIVVYWGLMSREFFAPTWLKAHPIVYLLSHMIIMPLIAFELLEVQKTDTSSISISFLALSFLNGVVLEIGRKIRQKSEEENGVETYSFLWGKDKALLVCLLAVFTSLIFFYQLVDIKIFSVLALVAVFFTFVAYKFNLNTNIKAKKIETLSGIWLLLSYSLIFINKVL